MPYVVIAISILGMVFRPFGVREVFWAGGGAALLVVCGWLPWRLAVQGVGQGVDVYLFLAGMMALAELARAQGLFDWLAAHVARGARGSPRRLFALVYGLAVVVTVFLSNDATAVVMTPAVAAMARAVGAKNPLPYLLICAFVANAASFVLPISNPANLVIFGAHMPPLAAWLQRFLLPSVLVIAATYGVLFFTQRRALTGLLATPDEPAPLSTGGAYTAWGLAGTAALLLLASTLGWQLGLPAFLAALASLLTVSTRTRQAQWGVLRHISFSTLLLVAGLFIMVQALDDYGVARHVAALLHRAPPGPAFWGLGLGLGFGTNLVNNLPAGLLAGHALAGQTAPLAAAALLGVDLGPNLSITGSLATILWLVALRRERIEVSAWQFLRLGAVVMPPALVLGLLGVFL
jgi:arsenical pump membrane protein